MYVDLHNMQVDIHTIDLAALAGAETKDSGFSNSTVEGSL